MKKTRHIVVTKHDGTLERFSAVKLTNCLADAMRAHGYDPRLAQPLARAVALHLQEWQGATPPSTGYIYRCVRSVLQQTGLGDVADELAAHRRMRRLRRRRVRVLDAGELQSGGEAWSKSVIVDTLRNEYDLRHVVARFMASRIEAQVFALDYRTVSRAFLRELVRNEILAWGLADTRTVSATVEACQPRVSTPRPAQEQ